jgi:hypothetical protein
MYVKTIDVWAGSFACRVCGLTLDDSLIDFADFDKVTLTEDDFDISAATQYFERQDHDWPDD